MAGYDISKLPAYTSEKSREFMLKSILGGQTIDLLTQFNSFDPTAKGSTAIQLMDVDTVWSNGRLCGRNELGDVRLEQAILSVEPIKLNMALCSRDLEPIFAVEDLKAKMKGQVYDEALYLDTIGNIIANKNQRDIESLCWAGSKDSSDAKLKFADGFLKALSTKTDLIEYEEVVGDVIEQLKAAYLATPIEVSAQDDFRIWIGQDTMNQIIALMAAKNLFHLDAKDTLHGTLGKLAVVNGLNGKGKAVFARARNLRAGGELDDLDIKHYYDQKDETINLNSRFSIGFQVIYSSEIGVLDLK